MVYLKKEWWVSFAGFYKQHILPKGFVKIRHYGYLCNHNRSKRLRELFAVMKLPPPPPKVQVPVSIRMLENFGKDIFQCPKCKKGRMEMIATFRRGVLVKTYEDEPNNKMVRNKDPAK